jgi:hypothetical protein
MKAKFENKNGKSKIVWDEVDNTLIIKTVKLNLAEINLIQVYIDKCVNQMKDLEASNYRY